MMSNETDYPYIKLNDLKPGSKKVYLYGVVRNFEVFSDSNEKRRLSLQITDESIGFEKSVKVLISAESENAKLPQVLQKLDIVRLHRVTVEEGTVIYGTMGIFGCQGLVWKGRPGADMTPASTSKKFTCTKQDQDAVRALRVWSHENERRDHDAPKVDCVSLSGFLQRGEYRDIVAQVIGVYETQRSTTVIRIWDGTKFSIANLVRVNLPHELKESFQFDEDLAKLAGDYAVDVFVYETFIEQAKQLKAGGFVKLGNVHTFFQSGCFNLSLVIHGLTFGSQSQDYSKNRGIWNLQPECAQVSVLKKRLDRIMLKQNTKNAVQKGAQTVIAGSDCDPQCSTSKIVASSERDVEPETSKIAASPKRSVEAKPWKSTAALKRSVETKPSKSAASQKRSAEAKASKIAASPERSVEAKAAESAVSLKGSVEAKPSESASSPKRSVEVKPSKSALSPMRSVLAKALEIAASPKRSVEANLEATKLKKFKPPPPQPPSAVSAALKSTMEDQNLTFDLMINLLIPADVGSAIDQMIENLVAEKRSRMSQITTNGTIATPTIPEENLYNDDYSSESESDNSMHTAMSSQSSEDIYSQSPSVYVRRSPRRALVSADVQTSQTLSSCYSTIETGTASSESAQSDESH